MSTDGANDGPIIHKAWVQEPDTRWRIGRGPYSIQDYYPRKVAAVRPGETVLTVGGLDEMLGSDIAALCAAERQALLVPRLFDLAAQDFREMRSISGRSGIETSQGEPVKTVVPLEKLFGDDYKGESHEAFIGRKGAGMPIARDGYKPRELSTTKWSTVLSWVRQTYGRELAAKVEREGPYNFDIITRSDYGDGRPEGGQDMCDGIEAIRAWDYMVTGKGRELGLKINPCIALLTYPAWLMDKAGELSEKPPLTTVEQDKPHWGTQELRLQFGNLRGSHIEMAEGYLLTRLVRTLGDNDAQVRKAIDRTYTDLARICDIAVRTIHADSGDPGLARWVSVGDTERVWNTDKYDKTGSFSGSPFGWYLLKDIVVSGIGASWVDLGGLYTDASAGAKQAAGALNWTMAIHIKDSLHLVAQLEAGYRQLETASVLQHRERLQIERQARERFYALLGESPYLGFKAQRDRLTLDTEPPGYRQVRLELPMTLFPMRSDAVPPPI